MSKQRWPKLRKVNSTRNSQCCSARLSDLDFSNWYSDNGHIHALHSADGGWMEGTRHRVYCRASDSPRLAVVDGELYWLIDEPKAKSLHMLARRAENRKD